jgi:predicted Rossmann fold flavoprotein
MAFDLLVAGAGPAGLFCGIHAASSGMRVCILEKGGSAGKKLRIAGSGRCNITNAASVQDFVGHYGEAARFVTPALRNFTNADLIEYFSDHGVPLVEMNGGKMFPVSQKSQDILKALLEDLSRLKVTVVYNSPIASVELDAGAFLVRSGDAVYRAKNFLIATGGSSYPVTGSTGDGYRFAQNLGHSIAETAPALTPVLVGDYRFAECAGISIKDAGIRIVRDGKTVCQTKGDVLFTHKGLSGPGILDSSRNIRKGDAILLQLSALSFADEVEKEILAALDASGTRTIKACVCAMEIPERLVLSVLSLCGVDGSQPLSRLNRESRKRISQAIAALSFTVRDLGGYDEAMVTRGGIFLSEVNPKTMESKITPGLYFAGEVLDIDGDTGGYNLQFAFSSGKLAADSMAKKRNAR